MNHIFSEKNIWYFYFEQFSAKKSDKWMSTNITKREKKGKKKNWTKYF